VIKLEKIKRTGHVACMQERICACRVLGGRNLRDKTTWKT